MDNTCYDTECQAEEWSALELAFGVDTDPLDGAAEISYCLRFVQPSALEQARMRPRLRREGALQSQAIRWLALGSPTVCLAALAAGASLLSGCGIKRAVPSEERPVPARYERPCASGTSYGTVTNNSKRAVDVFMSGGSWGTPIGTVEPGREAQFVVTGNRLVLAGGDPLVRVTHSCR